MLSALRDGDGDAANQLLPLVYDRLRALAGSYFRLERPNHTLEPTALVHEAYVRLVDQSGVEWENRAHFCAIAATAMRRILIDHARSRRAAKRGGGDRHAVTLDAAVSPLADQSVDAIALDEVLEKLESLDPRQYRIVELRFFGGLTVEEVADFLDVSRSTVEAEWRMARAWLSAELGRADHR